LRIVRTAYRARICLMAVCVPALMLRNAHRQSAASERFAFAFLAIKRGCV
jgi:hypothetical protein